jgi:hypothetical protein
MPPFTETGNRSGVTSIAYAPAFNSGLGSAATADQEDSEAMANASSGLTGGSFPVGNTA